MKTLNTKLTWLFTGALLLSASPVIAGIANSQHDLSSTGTEAGATDEICVFCHTPHGGDTSEAGLPLWNKTLPSGTGYTRYSSTGTPSFDSTEADVGSISLACLSCHDGVQAMDSVINKPGSGGWSNTAGNTMGGMGPMADSGTPVPMLDTDLSDDHPISIPYAAGGCDSTDGDGACSATLGDPDFNYPWKATVNSQPVWWVNTTEGAGTQREKVDLPLYTRLEDSTTQPFVECGSCHDPHNADSKVAGETVAFLRTSNNAGSKICVACHNK